jgi:cytochrome c556
MTILTFGRIGAAALCLSACSAPAPEQAAAAVPGPAAVAAATPMTATPEVSINEVMVAVVDHAGHNLWDVEEEGKAPKTDADWDNIWEHAVQMAAAGPAITVGGTGSSDAKWVSSPSWHTYAQKMSDAAVAARHAAKSKDFTALVAANGQLVESCEQCHKEFKPTLPTEGVVHDHKHQ